MFIKLFSSLKVLASLHNAAEFRFYGPCGDICFPQYRQNLTHTHIFIAMYIFSNWGHTQREALSHLPQFGGQFYSQTTAKYTHNTISWLIKVKHTQTA